MKYGWWKMPKGTLVQIDKINYLTPHSPAPQYYRHTSGRIVDAPTVDTVPVFGHASIRDAGMDAYLTEAEYRSLEQLLLHNDHAGIHADYLEEHGFTEAAALLRQQFGTAP